MLQFMFVALTPRPPGTPRKCLKMYQHIYHTFVACSRKLRATHSLKKAEDSSVSTAKLLQLFVNQRIKMKIVCSVLKWV